MKTTTIEKVKPGTLVRRSGFKAVFIRGEYCRLNKAYECGSYDDISVAKYWRRGTRVEIDFDLPDNF